jgi:hypothetical protein
MAYCPRIRVEDLGKITTILGLPVTWPCLKLGTLPNLIRDRYRYTDVLDARI